MFELPTERRDELVEQWAKLLVDRGWGTAAVFLLEAHKPLSGLAAHGVVAFQPLISRLTSVNCSELSGFLRESDNLERLVRRIEELERTRESSAPR